MTGWLLDTNLLSELRRVRHKPRVVDFITSQALDRLFVSEVTFAEIRFGIEFSTDAARRSELHDCLTSRSGRRCSSSESFQSRETSC